MSNSGLFRQSSVDGILEKYGEKLVDCPNPECDGTIDAQRIIAFCPRSDDDRQFEEFGFYETTDCCGLDRDELFELVEPDRDDEPMDAAYDFEVDA